MAFTVEDCPSSVVLILNNILATFFQFLRAEKWHRHLPFGLGSLAVFSDDYPIKINIADYLPPTLSYQDYLLQTQSKFGLRSLVDFAFKTPTTSLSVLTSFDGIVVLTIVVLIIHKIKSIVLPLFEKLGRTAGRYRHGVEWEVKNEVKITKFAEYLFRLIYHSSVTIFGFWYFWDKPWWNQSLGGTATVFINYPHQPVEVLMTWYYLVQAAYNVEAVIALLELSFTFNLQNPFGKIKNGLIQTPLKISWSPTVRGDFREMALHHVITNALIIGSSHLRFTRIGSMVFFVHDISDVPVDLSKLAHFLNLKLATATFFVILLIVWVITRLGILPFMIFKSIIYQSDLTYTHGGIDIVLYRLYIAWFFFLLAAIIALHVFWFIILIRIAWHLVSKGEHHDMSEHKSGENQDSIKKDK